MKRTYIRFVLGFFITIFLIAILVLFIYGYRPIIPEGNSYPDWSAIGVIATIAFSIGTLIISCFALYQSINTTKQQNKIALFEKRHKAFNGFKKLYMTGIKSIAGQNNDFSKTI